MPSVIAQRPTASQFEQSDAFQVVASGKLLGETADLIGEVDGLLVDEEFLELERHSAALGEDSRAVESRPSREEKV